MERRYLTAIIIVTLHTAVIKPLQIGSFDKCAILGLRKTDTTRSRSRRDFVHWCSLESTPSQ